MRTAIATEPGSATTPNEDYAAATPELVVVLDGLSAPAGMSTGCVHGTPWYVRHLASALIDAAAGTPDAALTDLLAAAITTVAGQHADTCDLADSGTPSSTVAILREAPETIDWLVLADASIALDTSTGIHVHSDNRVERVAGEAVATALSPTSSAEHEQHVAELVAQQRRVRNQPGGYWVAAASPDAAKHALTGTIARTDLRQALVATDGVTRLTDWQLADWTDLIEAAAAAGPADLIRRVRDAEARDPEGQRWPRYKTSDDATAVYCSIDRGAAQ